jgi:predicted ATPase/DNA-binding SARP family transcriptional activator
VSGDGLTTGNNSGRPHVYRGVGGGGGGGLRFEVLGPLRVTRDGAEIVLPRRRQRLVLARLLADVGEVVSAKRLMAEIWGCRVPATGTGPLRTNVWELRGLLGEDTGAGGDRVPTAGVVVSRRGGYALAVDRDQVDSARFEDLLTAATAPAGDPQSRLARVEAALELWRGPAFGELAGEPALQVEGARLDQLHLSAQEVRAGLLLDLGRHEQVAAELGEVARANPERERLWGSLMVALYRCGRQGDALRCYQEARSRLVDAIGVEPGPELRQLEQAILRHDPALEPRSPPPPVASGRGRHNLPRPLTSLVGRGAERRAVAEAVGQARLVSLIGPGGCGKTRLAVAVAEDVLSRFAGGVRFVDLSSAPAPGAVPGMVAAELGGVSPDDDEVLLVLDSCEHLAGPVADYVSQLLEGTARLRVLATSREELRLPGETVHRVAGLGLPSTGDDRPFLGSDAVELFVRRGAAALSDFAPGAGGLDLIARICRRLDGLPLAIELAASLVGTLPVAEIARRVDGSYSVLDDLPRRGLSRHRSLGAAIDWSFDRLDGSTQELFVQLGVFAGSFTLTAVEAVAAGSAGRRPLLPGLGSLVRASLLEQVAGPEGVERYRMLQTVREYAVDRLHQRADVALLRARHARWVADFAAEADLGMRGPASAGWRAQVEAELPNARAALQWAMAGDDVELALRIVASLRWFLSRLGPPDDLGRRFDRRLSRQPDLSPPLRLGLLTTAAMAALLGGDSDRAGRQGREAVAAARALGDDRHLAIALVTCAGAALGLGDVAGVGEHLDEAHSLCDRLGDRWGLAWVLVGRAHLAQRAGRSHEARRCMEDALDVFRGLGDLHSQVVPLGSLALLALDAGKPQAAIELASEAQRTVTVLEYDDARHAASAVLGLAELAAGHPVPARDLLLASLRQLRPDRSNAFVSFDLEGLAALAATIGNLEAAAKLLGLAQRVCLAGRTNPTPAWDAAVAGVLGTVRRWLGPEATQRFLQQGRRLDVGDAVALAEAATSRLPPLPSARERTRQGPEELVYDDEQTSTSSGDSVSNPRA